MRTFLCAPIVLLALVNLTQAVLYLGVNRVNWWQANIVCRQNNLRLVVIDSPSKQQEVANHILQQNAAQVDFWISGTNLNDPATGRYWWMSNGQPLQYTNWEINQPDNYRGVEHCVHIWANHNQKWNDIPCENQYNFICEDTCCGC